MRPIQMVDLKQQYLKIKPEIDAAVLNVLDSSVFIGGPAGKCFCWQPFTVSGRKKCGPLRQWN